MTGGCCLFYDGKFSDVSDFLSFFFRFHGPIIRARRQVHRGPGGFKGLPPIQRFHHLGGGVLQHQLTCERVDFLRNPIRVFHFHPQHRVPPVTGLGRA